MHSVIVCLVGMLVYVAIMFAFEPFFVSLSVELIHETENEAQGKTVCLCIPNISHASTICSTNDNKD